MIKVEFTMYKNDYDKRMGDKRFSSLQDLESWIFGSIKQKYDHNNFVMYFPDNPSRILFRPAPGEYSYWIHTIQNNEGYMFTDGNMTCGQKHMNDEVKQWCKHCMERRDNPQFNFV